MHVIAPQVYIEDQFPGVTLGVIVLSQGLIQVDAPPAPEDGRAWRASLMSLNTGVERMLVNLDAHPDRTLGARAMDCVVVAHEKTAAVFRNRPNTFKAQGDETGADWEQVVGMGSIRWVPPEVTFTQNMAIHWGSVPLELQSHPGPASGAIWAVLPTEKVAFVGDLVLRNQPPFLASAHLPDWIASLNELLKPEYQNFAIVSGRGGVVAESTIRAQLELMQELHSRLEALGKAQAGPDSTDALIPFVLETVKSPAERQKQHIQRLSYGLRHYYARHYQSGKNISEVDEE